MSSRAIALRSIGVVCLLGVLLSGVAWGQLGSCHGDCDNNGVVTIDEILTMVRIGLGDAPASACIPGDLDADGRITVDELLDAVTRALAGCANSGPPLPVLYVRETGSDAGSGASRDDALRTIGHAAQIAVDGTIIIVGAGTYHESVTTERPSSSPPQGISFFADTLGVISGDPAGPVIVDPAGVGPAFHVSGVGAALMEGYSVHPVIQGFTIMGASAAGILTQGGSDLVIQDCLVTETEGDGIVIQGTSNTVVFNNLIFDNTDTGVTVVQGAVGVSILSNTIARNDNRGISIGNTAQVASGTIIRNNIVQDNGGDASIAILPPSDQSYVGGFNLVRPDVYDPTRIRRVQDIHDDAEFVAADAAEFSLQTSSPAINAGAALSGTVTADLARVTSGTLCFMRNPGACDVALTDYLNRRTTTGAAHCDRGALDLGFHALPVSGCGG
jgi:parallel beta-helix repeat protein